MLAFLYRAIPVGLISKFTFVSFIPGPVVTVGVDMKKDRAVIRGSTTCVRYVISNRNGSEQRKTDENREKLPTTLITGAFAARGVLHTNEADDFGLSSRICRMKTLLQKSVS